jgi:hypothetical protein
VARREDIGTENDSTDNPHGDVATNAKKDELGVILERVKKLMALAKSDNEHEAALALAQAQRLMTKHSIEQGMLDESEPLKEGVVARAARFEIWLTRLYLAVAEANGCVAMTYSMKGQSERSLKFVGRKDDIVTGRAMAAYVESEIERLAHPLSWIRDRVWINSYKEGLVDTISMKLKEATMAVAQEMENEGGTGMVRYVEERVQKIHDELEKDGCKKTPLKSNARGHADARFMGQIDGTQINPHHKGQGLERPAAGYLPDDDDAADHD